MNYTDFIFPLLQQAAKIAVDSFGNVINVVKSGDNNQVLTETDLTIGKLLIESILKTFPEHNIIDEEAGVIDNNSSFTWVIDPIDGTSNFANGIHQYGIMIGLLENHIPIAGGIALPAYDELYSAELGKGAFCNNEKVRVTSETDIINCLIAYGIDGHQEDSKLTHTECDTLANIILNIRNLRTSNSAYDTMLVAKGSYGGLLNKTSKIWDNVANHIILEEAGAKYTDYWGKPQNYTDILSRHTENFTVCTASPVLHEALQTIIGIVP